MKWRITFLRQTLETAGPFDERLDEWIELGTVWAQKIHKSEDERFAAEQLYESRIASFRVYPQGEFGDGTTTERGPLTAAERVRCDGLMYNIRGLREIGFRRGLEISAEFQD